MIYKKNSVLFKYKNIQKNTLFLFFSLILFFIISSCKIKEVNYIIYYNKVNEIDSIYRMANQPRKAIKQYRNLFRKYSPKNQEQIEEFATYIKLSEKYNKNFGEKKSIIKLIPLLAPYGNDYNKFSVLFEKYGMDSITVNQKMKDWKNGLNKKLIDSFTVAMIRDQEGRPSNHEIVKKNVEKNAKLFLWTFKNYGFPSLQKIGNKGNNNVFIAMPTLLSHMISSENYPIIRNKLSEYLKLGEISPRDYARMSDTYDYYKNTVSKFGFGLSAIKDSVKINCTRKSIGLPSLKHSAKIRKDFSKLK